MIGNLLFNIVDTFFYIVNMILNDEKILMLLAIILTLLFGLIAMHVAKAGSSGPHY